MVRMNGHGNRQQQKREHQKRRKAGRWYKDDDEGKQYQTHSLLHDLRLVRDINFLFVFSIDSYIRVGAELKCHQKSAS